MKNLLASFVLLLLVAANATFGFSQTVTKAEDEFLLTLQNVVLSSEKTLEFDLYLKSMDKKTPFDLALFQACIILNPAFYEGGEISVELVEGMSELNENQQPQTVIFSKESNSLKLPSRTLKPAPQNTTSVKQRGTLISANDKGTRLCRIKISNTKAFTKAPVRLAFNFSKQPYPTMVSRYKDGINTPLICHEHNCVVK